MSRAQLIGWAQFVHQVQAPQGQALLAQALAVLPPAGTVAVTTVNALAQQAGRLRFRQAAAQGQVPPLASGSWWQPASPAAPTLSLTDQQRREARRAKSQIARTQAAADAPASTTPQHGARLTTPDPRLAQSNQPTSSSVNSPRKEAGKSPPRNFVIYLLQLAAAWALGTRVLDDRRFTIAAFAILVFLYFARKQSWFAWAGAMLVAGIIAHNLRFLG